MVALPKDVYLWSLANPVVIVPAPTGVIFCNQVDGVATVQRQLEGMLVPLPRMDAEIFDPSWWERNFNRRVRGDEIEWKSVCERIVAALNAALSGGETPTDFRVIAHPDNAEAWVHVSFRFPELGESANGTELIAVEGVLTWQNCD